MRIKLAAAAIVALVLIGLGFGAARWYYGNKLVDAQRDRANALADADSLREVTGGFERRAWIAENEAALMEGINESLADRIEDLGLRVRSVTRTVASLEARVELEGGEPEASGDTLSATFAHADSTFSVDADVEMSPRHSLATITTRAEIGMSISTSCDPDTGEPFAHASVTDPRVTLHRLDTTVDEDVACLGQRRPSLFGFDLRPGPKAGAVLGAAAGGGIGAAVSGGNLKAAAIGTGVGAAGGALYGWVSGD